jgi:hypothetical protein
MPYAPFGLRVGAKIKEGNRRAMIYPLVDAASKAGQPMARGYLMESDHEPGGAWPPEVADLIHEEVIPHVSDVATRKLDEGMEVPELVGHIREWLRQLS